MLGVCHTCHVPIYYGEPIHKLQTRDDESSYSGMAAGGYADRVGGIGWKGNRKSHSELEGWIQCGFCYGSYKEEMAALKKWETEWKKWGWIIGIPCGIIGAGVGFYLIKYTNIEKKQGWGIGAMFWMGLLSFVAGSFIGGLIWRWKRGKKPEPDRYKVRKNPYRDTLVWELDNEGNPVKEGSAQINKYGMILDPERDKVKSAEQKDKINKNKGN